MDRKGKRFFGSFEWKTFDLLPFLPFFPFILLLFSDWETFRGDRVRIFRERLNRRFLGNMERFKMYTGGL